MQFESHSHRGFSPVISSVTKQGGIKDLTEQLSTR